ncbi:hypothetical protein [uncultured Deefgea sp.]|uniref:hypothetical protein n=1 Tax=uncultured Deefgea sp. TaxID=1304914 RepID=UPI002594774E|nr:hypothetical protein [uncultured Deefgea sp.]
MNTYPTINWWPGNLPPYESITSFLTRFCDLNRLTLNQAETYLGLALHRDYTDADVARVAGLLNEDPFIVRSVLKPSFKFNNFGLYALPTRKTNGHSIRYCEKCAALGYHSDLHEIEYLQKCPFHMIDLRKSYYVGNSGSWTQRNMKAVQEIMCLSSKTWPAVKGSDCAIDELGQLKQLSEWLTKASNAAIQLSQGQIWFFGEDDYSRDEIPLGQAIGQLRTLSPMPETIESLFVEVGEPWELVTNKFPRKVNTEWIKLRSHMPFCDLLDFYKKISGHSSHPPRFIILCREAQALINARHGSKCHCCWGQMTLGWYIYHWIRVDPDAWPHWNLKCPYDVTVHELELGWGCATSVLSHHRVQKETFRFIQLSHDMHDAGLIENTPTARASESGHLYAFPQVWPCCEWNNKSPLTRLLNAIAELELQFVHHDLRTWLDDLDKGLDPYTRKNLTGCMRLCETPDGLLLVSWCHPPKA